MIGWEFKVASAAVGLVLAGVIGYTRGYEKGAAQVTNLTVQNVELARNLHVCRDGKLSVETDNDRLRQEIMKGVEESARSRKFTLAQIQKAKSRQVELEGRLREELSKPMPKDKSKWIKEIAQSLARQMEELK